MIKNDFSSVVKILACVLFVASLMIIPSCKKSPSEPPAENPDVQAIVEPVSETSEDTSEDAVDNSGWEPIKIDLPDAMFIGTPQDIDVENLEKPLGKPRPPFLAPKGTENVALGKSVTSSDDDPIFGKLEYITDGNKEAADGCFVELMPLKQHVTIDLEAVHEIWAVIVWHYHLQARVYYDVIVQVASDPDFIIDVKTIFNNDIDNSYGLGIGEDMHYVETNEGKLIEGKGVKGRYVRLYSNKNTYDDLNHYIEVNVYGKPVD